MKRLIFIISSFLFFQCAGPELEENNLDNSKLELEELKEINNQLIKTNPKDLKTIYQLGVQVKNTSLNLYVRNNKALYS